MSIDASTRTSFIVKFFNTSGKITHYFTKRHTRRLFVIVPKKTRAVTDRTNMNSSELEALLDVPTPITSDLVTTEPALELFCGQLLRAVPTAVESIHPRPSSTEGS